MVGSSFSDDAENAIFFEMLIIGEMYCESDNRDNFGVVSHNSHLIALGQKKGPCKGEQSFQPFFFI